MNPEEDSVQIRSQIHPGDIGEIIRLHGILYTEEYGWDVSFEGYVAASFGEFVLSADPERSRLWILEKEGGILGSIGIVGRKGSDEAQLRWYWIDPTYRGRGYGHRLMQEALQFCRDQQFRSVYLWTVSELEAAARVYQSFGFEKTEEETHPLWGKMITEIRYDLDLSRTPQQG